MPLAVSATVVLRHCRTDRQPVCVKYHWVRQRQIADFVTVTVAQDTILVIVLAELISPDMSVRVPSPPSTRGAGLGKRSAEIAAVAR